jgi:hypothetical protein
LAVRASKKLRSDELLLTGFAATRLRMELDRVPLWRGDHVAANQLVEDFARYLYLPRLKDSNVLTAAVQDGLGLLLWKDETFAYADSYDEGAKRYRGLRCGQQIAVSLDNAGALLVKADAALKQQAADAAAAAAQTPGPGITGQPPATPPGTGAGVPERSGSPATRARALRRFHGTVKLDPTRVGRDAGRIADEVIVHLAGLVNSDVTVELHIAAHIPLGVPDNVIRTVTENSRTLKFTNQGFEEE